MYEEVTPAQKSCTAKVWAQFSMLDRKTRFTRLSVAGIWDRLLRGLLWLGSRFHFGSLLARWRQRPPLQSARARKGKSGQRRKNKVNKEGSVRAQRKVKGPDPHQCAWFEIDQLVAQGNVRPGLRRNVTLHCPQSVNQVDRIDCAIDTMDLARARMHLSYVITNPQTGDQRRVEHSVGLATSAGKWWFDDTGHCCKMLCLPPGGDRFAHPEIHGIGLDSEGKLANPVREPREARLIKRTSKKVTWALASCHIKKVARRCFALCQYGRWRNVLSSLTCTLVRQLGRVAARSQSLLWAVRSAASWSSTSRVSANILSREIH